VPTYVPAVNETLSPMQLDGGATIGGALLPPAAFGFQAWTLPPTLAGQSFVALTTVVYLNGVWLPAGMTLTNTYLNVNTAVATTHTVTGIYSPAGALVATSADGTTLGGASVGLKTSALTATYVVPTSAMYWLAMTITTAGSPAYAAGGTLLSNTILAGGATQLVTSLPFAANGTGGGATLPSTLTLSSNTATAAAPIWMAAS
jgi:hypothetical protein